ncbi:hypothetical protein [Spirosoma sp.]|uniref:hypothetical protein n=1 Tax=Spirosoma sp. TaxID=1899569 RepID=UPI00260BF898|nr:hypothetical protein [Spirosoma sp.]MCX6213246.1 hypothetical protein [Spirosoma sp.]
METVFDHSLTPAEELIYLDTLHCIYHGIQFPEPITESVYRSFITPAGAAFDLYLLFSERGKKAKAATYAALVPERVQEYLLGFDYKIISVRKRK